MIAAIVYYWDSLFKSQTWIPPILILCLTATVLLSAPPVEESAVAVTLATSFPLSMWLSYAICRMEDPGQQEITISSLGSLNKVIMARGLASATFVPPIGLVVIVIVAITQRFSLYTTFLTIGNLIFIVAVGVSIGSLLGSGVKHRPGWSTIIILVTALLALAIPYAPPVRSSLELLFLAPDVNFVTLLLQTITSLLMAIGTMWFAAKIAHRNY